MSETDRESIFSLRKDEAEAFELMRQGTAVTDDPEEEDQQEDPGSDENQAAEADAWDKDVPEEEGPQDGPDPEEDEEGEEPQDEPRRRTVPLEALHEARMEARRLRDELLRERAEREAIARQSQEQHAILEQRMAELHSRLEPQYEEYPRPAWDQDPIGAGMTLEQQVYALQEQMAARDAWEAEQAEQARQQAEWQAQWDAAKQRGLQDWQEMRRRVPQADDAYQHLRISRARELLNAHKVPRELLRQKLDEEEELAIVRAVVEGDNIGNRVLEMAYARGYRPGRKVPQGGQGNGVARPSEQEARRRSRSLSATGGSAPGGSKLSQESLYKMSDAEFAKFADKYPAKLNKLMGA